MIKSNNHQVTGNWKLATGNQQLEPDNMNIIIRKATSSIARLYLWACGIHKGRGNPSLSSLFNEIAIPIFIGTGSVA